MKASFSAFLIVIVLIVFASCQDSYNICELSRDVRMKGGLYHVNGSVESNAISPSFTFFLLNSNNFLYNKTPNLSKFTANLNSIFDTSKFYIQLSDVLPADTLTVVYTTQDVLLSTECGTVLVNNISKVSSTSNTIDSAVLINPVNNTTSSENIKIYY